MKVGRTALAYALGLSVCGTAAGGYALATNSAVGRGWAPLVTLAGKGNERAALDNLKRIASTLDSVLDRMEIDQATEEFTEAAWEELEDFHLDDFEELLPYENGGFREVGTRGELVGKTYKVTRAKPGTPFEVTMNGARHKLGDFSSVLRAKHTRTHGDDKAFLVQARSGIGIGTIPWNAITSATTDALRLVSTGDPTASGGPPIKASDAAIANVKRAHPKLAAEDVEVMALLWDAYPALSDTVSQIARIDDVRDVATGPVHKLHAVARLMPERMQKGSPKLAKHMGKLKELMNAKIRFVDTRGRSIFEASIDTQSLTSRFDCYVKDGALLPFTKDHVFVEEPIDPLGNQLAKSRIIVDAKMKMLGVVIHLDRMRVNIQYKPEGTLAHMKGSVTEVPGIRVEGAALGFVPTGLVDLMIPGNIESLTREFFDVAVRGNEGRGVAVAVDLGSPKEGADAVIESSLGVEALDNFMVKMGVGIVNDRVLPDDDAREEIEALLKRLHQAFTKDLSRFAAQTAG